MTVKDAIFYVVAGTMYLVAVLYNVGMLIDPVKTSEFERKYWWRGQNFVWRANPEELGASSRKRLSARLGAAVFLGILFMLAYVVSTMKEQHR